MAPRARAAMAAAGFAATLALPAACTMTNPAFGVDGTGSAEGTGGDATTKGTLSSTDSPSTTNPTDTASASAEGTSLPDTMTAGDTTANADSTGVAQTGPSSETDTGSGTLGTSSTAGETTNPATTEAGGSSGGPNACALAGAACQLCMAEFCCDELQLCQDADGCACVAECVGNGDTAVACIEACGLGEAPLGWAPLFACVLDLCPDGDECPNVEGG